MLSPEQGPLLPVKLDATFHEVLRAMQDRPFLESEKHQAQHARAVRKGANVDILDFERALLRRFRKLNVPMYAHNMVRTHDEQKALFVRGVSRTPDKSAHLYGCAVDIVHGTRHWEMPRKAWDLVGHLGKEVAQSLGVKITWGGDFKSLYDPAHWELTGWRELPHAALGV